MSRTIGKEISPSRSASCGHGPTLIIWWTAGVSGIEMPAMSPILGLHTPQAITTCSASITPPVVWTATNPTVDHLEVGHLDVRHDRERPGGQRLLAHEGAGPQGVHDADARRPERADELVRLDERHLLLDELRT